MRATAARRHRPIQVRPRHKLCELKPIRLDSHRLNYAREAIKLVLSVGAVIAAVLVWVVF